MSTNAEPAAVIQAYPDGPLLVRGDFELLGEDGRPVRTERATIALCRCGRSAIAPLCDGTHTLLRKHPRTGDQP
jgi:CDGSH-type Zn-finger protein